jgi:RNA polymerase-binding transcription factor DksA
MSVNEDSEETPRCIRCGNEIDPAKKWNGPFCSDCIEAQMVSWTEADPGLAELVRKAE